MNNNYGLALFNSYSIINKLNTCTVVQLLGYQYSVQYNAINTCMNSHLTRAGGSKSIQHQDSQSRFDQYLFKWQAITLNWHITFMYSSPSKISEIRDAICGTNLLSVIEGSTLQAVPHISAHILPAESVANTWDVANLNNLSNATWR